MIKFVKAVLSASIAVSLGIAACASNAADIKERNFKVAFVQQKDHPQGLSLERSRSSRTRRAVARSRSDCSPAELSEAMLR
jgi:hypothetical protein